MDIELSEEQVQLRDSARKFMQEECTGAFVRLMEQGELGYSPEMWKRMADLGWLGISLPEAFGGLGLGAVDLVILARELGRNLCPSPFLPTVVIAGEAIARGGSAAQQEAHLPAIIAGDLVVGFAYQEYTRRFAPGVIAMSAREDGADYVLDGTKMFVEFAGAADLLLVAARTSGAPPSADGLSLFLVDASSPGITSVHTPTVARDRHYRVTFEGVRVPKDRLLGNAGDAWSVLEGVIERAAVVFSGFTGGVCEKMHEDATRYAKNRVQFGRPIGQMQLIQSYLATLMIEMWGADTLTLFTAFHMDKGRKVRDYVAKTKVFAADTVNRVTNIGAQIFGGLGYMEEQDNTLYLRRGKQYQHMLGGLEYWEDIIAEELLDQEHPTILT
jgi:alkylation response protein AidB-like acyl-CoA dehydrogenase